MNDRWATVLNVPATWRLSAKIRAKVIASRPLSIAPVWVTGLVIKQKSADGIVPKVIGNDFREGPNISQGAARFISTHGDELAVKRGSES
jgi:hypothetical protein